MNYNSIDISILFPLKFLEFEPISCKKTKNHCGLYNFQQEKSSYFIHLQFGPCLSIFGPIFIKITVILVLFFGF